MRHPSIFLIIISAIFLAITAIFIALPRSTFSQLERRELASFPPFTLDSLRSGLFTRDVSSWFSDSQPLRDHLMTLHLQIKSLLAWHPGPDSTHITFHAPDQPLKPRPTPDNLQAANRNPEQYENQITANAVAKIANAGIIIVGQGSDVRALMAYGGHPEGGTNYANIANLYARTFGPSVQVYCMVIPTAVEFYCPQKVKSRIKPQLPTIRNIYAHLSDSVKAIDVYTILGQHAAEPIYLRTDHHWSPLGAYYAAAQFARVAQVPFLPLNRYQRNVIEGFVGTMYGYSRDIAIKNAPEDFIYYTPLDTTYQATYINFTLDKDFKVTGRTAPHQAPFFKTWKSKAMAYSTFMGGDAMIVKVNTGHNTGRRLAIIKDSFGNAIPPFLFHSFDEIHILDHRYFPDNITTYVRNNKITDLLLLNNIFNAYSDGVCQAYRKLLTN